MFETKLYDINYFHEMLSNTGKYAVRALIYLGRYSEENRKIGIKKISSDLHIPTPFLGKILQNLVRKKILVSAKGPNGGFCLGKKADEISLYDIVRIIEGDDYFTVCLICNHQCPSNESNEKQCSLHGRYSPIRAQMLQFFQETTLADILCDITGFEDLIKL